MSRPANPKDALIAWAYAYLRAQSAQWNRRTRVDEFVAACHDIIPDIAQMAVVVDHHADEAVRLARAEQNRLADEIWETKSDD